MAINPNNPFTPPPPTIEQARQELIYDLYRLEDRLTEAQTKDRGDQCRIGMEIHGKLRRAKLEFDTDPRGYGDDVKNLMRHLTQRLMLEVFDLQDSAETPVDPTLLPPRPEALPRPQLTCVACGSHNIDWQ